MTEVFRSSKAAVSSKSALFVAWGQLLTYDMALTVDNTSEPFDIDCDDGGGTADVWCPLGTASEAIPFFRSSATVSDSVRSPINYATSYIDLDFVYGRSEEEALALRTMEGGFMNVTESGVPHRKADGTWLVWKWAWFCFYSRYGWRCISRGYSDEPAAVLLKALKLLLPRLVA